MPGKNWRKAVRSSRVFVESQFGRGSAASKITRNANTMLRALENAHKTKDTAFDRGEALWLLKKAKKKGGAYSFQWGKNKSNRIVYIPFSVKTSFPAEQRLIHEFAQNAVNKIRRKIGKKENVFIEESIALSCEIDWLVDNNIDSCFRRLADFSDGYKRLENVGSSEVLNKLHPHDVGRAAAHLIFNKYPGSQLARKKLRLKLMQMDFKSVKDLLEWIKHYNK